MLPEIVKRFVQVVQGWLQGTVGDIPWLRAIGPVVSTAAVLAAVVAALPAQAAWITRQPLFWPAVIVALAFLYFLLVAVYASAAVRTERRLRSLAQAFRYDNRGTLFNGWEPNIAFRIPTFTGILEGLKDGIPERRLTESLRAAGSVAAADFAANLSSIYEADVRSKKPRSRWEDLGIADKLNEWAEYDSATGWGLVTVTSRGDSIEVRFTHLKGLFASEGGHFFGYFLSGYCETVIANILKEHDSGNYAGATSARCEGEPRFTEESVTLVYSAI